MDKTRLTVELARANLEMSADGVDLVALAPLASADAIASAIMRALDLMAPDGEHERALATLSSSTQCAQRYCDIVPQHVIYPWLV